MIADYAAMALPILFNIPKKSLLRSSYPKASCQIFVPKNPLTQNFNLLDSKQTLTCGIPQGTILGSLLFLLYINDLPNCLSDSQSRMYVDDTHLPYANNAICFIEASLNQDLSNINRCLIASKLTLNMTKTEFLLTGSRQKLNGLAVRPEINSTQSNRVNVTKHLAY